MPSKVIEHKLVSALCAAAMLFVLGGMLWSYLAFRNITSPLVLHWTEGVGITQVGGLSQPMGAGLVGIVMVLINSVLAFELESRDPWLGKIVAAMTLVAAVLLFIAAAAIISVN